jgi:hypothetical protein
MSTITLSLQRMLLSALLLLPVASVSAVRSPNDDAPWVISNGQPGTGLYMPREVQQAYAKGTRSHDGRPGKDYWQNEATHRMRITLNPPSKRVQGEQEIVYTNNSPDALSLLIFRLYANAHQAEALREKSVATEFLADGITVDEFSIDGVTKPWDNPADPLKSVNVRGSTIHAVMLDKPLPARSSVRIRIRWHYDLVGDAGWKEGAIDESTFFLAYFFPRVTNYSDYNGWDSSPFTLGREFNNDFADFEVDVDVPRDYVVWATGTLQNPGEVLQPGVARKRGRHPSRGGRHQSRQGHRPRRSPDLEMAGDARARLRHRGQQQLPLAGLQRGGRPGEQTPDQRAGRLRRARHRFRRAGRIGAQEPAVRVHRLPRCALPVPENSCSAAPTRNTR